MIDTLAWRSQRFGTVPARMSLKDILTTCANWLQYYFKWFGFFLTTMLIQIYSWLVAIASNRGIDMDMSNFSYLMESATYMTTGVRFLYENGPEEDAVLRDLLSTGAILVMNHQSILDTLGISYIHRIARPLAKRSILYTPYGLLGSKVGMIFIDRNKPRQAMQLMRAGFDRLKKHSLSMYMYPEGTRCQDLKNPELRPLKNGAFVLAIEKKVGTCNIFSHGFSLRFLRQNLRRVL